MKLNEAYDYVKMAVEKKIPVMLHGAPGLGKSAIIHQIAKELKMQVRDIRLAQIDPTDLRGIPMPNRETMRAEWLTPKFWPDRNADGNGVDGPGIIFLDEIEKAQVSVKNASLQLVLDRCVGDYHLPNDWAIVCAGNREEDGAFSQPLGSALSNRMAHLDIEPDVDAWASWARENGVLEDIIGFVHFKPELLHKNTEEHAFPSPRSWVMASNLISSAKNKKHRKELLNASVGKGTSQEFTVWSEVYRDVDVPKILDGEMPKFGDADQSFKYAVTLAVAFYVRKHKFAGKEEGLAKFLLTITPELRVVFLKQLTLTDLEKMQKHVAFKSMVKELMRTII
jgi:MoxR-like ATPase